MKLRLSSWRQVLLLFLLVIGAGVVLWGFFRSEAYRADTNIILGENYEVLWRCSQIREKAADLAAMMASPTFEGKVDVRLQRQAQLLKFNIGAIRSLPYFDKFFTSADAENLDRAQEILTNKIIPRLKAGSVDANVIGLFEGIRDSMYAATGSAISSGRALSESADIEGRARSNLIIAIVAVFLVVIIVVVGAVLYLDARRRSRFLHSFSALYAHMTRSRLYALVLFLRRLKDGRPADPAMIIAAHQAAEELSAINESLNQIVATKVPKDLEQLRATVERLSDMHPGQILREITADALTTNVASPHIYMILDELVENSRRALEAAGREASAIIVRGKIVTSFLFRKSLAIEVVDHGGGMSAEEAEQAVEPFYSSRAGSHVGLGLTGCEEMIRALGGTLRIVSSVGEGTTVRVVYPLKAAGAQVGAIE